MNHNIYGVFFGTNWTGLEYEALKTDLTFIIFMLDRTNADFRRESK
jgi:hypothetical protein